MAFSPPDEIGSAIEALLAEHGPMTEQQLMAALADTGIDLGADPEDTLSEVFDGDIGLIMPLADERWVWLPSLLTGRIFSHRLDARELEHDLLTINPDLIPVSMLGESEIYQQLTDGSPLAEVMVPFDSAVLEERGIPFDMVDDHGALLLPRGRLAELGVSAGDLVGLRVTPTGLQLETVEEREVTPGSAELGDRLNAILAVEPDEPQQLDIAAWTACADDAALFARAMPPLGQLLAECGLPHDGDYVAGSGFDFGHWRVVNRIESIARDTSERRVAFYVGRKNFFMGRWIKHAMPPGHIMRFFVPASIRFERLVNPVPVVQGGHGYLHQLILHYNFSKGIAEWIEKHNKYSTLEALEGMKEPGDAPGTEPSLSSRDPAHRRRALKRLSFRLPARSLLKFLYLYFIQRGFLDGRAGFDYCVLQGIYEHMITLKMTEAARRKRGLPV